ncbi:hypothetical protein C8J55DRAFT_493841 [Lentinula edodes]|uniref:Uncharacterized protein n=1 Tax=Lentinula lateritia TaxID=40482 RepID=A0A9W9DDI6_9AGAR|nr:hypothetical protein C8J55DRAFT_493841 [Lentinula edodes]
MEDCIFLPKLDFVIGVYGHAIKPLCVQTLKRGSSGYFLGSLAYAMEEHQSVKALTLGDEEHAIPIDAVYDFSCGAPNLTNLTLCLQGREAPVQLNTVTWEADFYSILFQSYWALTTLTLLIPFTLLATATFLFAPATATVIATVISNQLYISTCRLLLPPFRYHLPQPQSLSLRPAVAIVYKIWTSYAGVCCRGPEIFAGRRIWEHDVSGSGMGLLDRKDQKDEDSALLNKQKYYGKM